MIKIKDGCCECNGTGGELFMELSIITKAVHDAIASSINEELADDGIHKAIERSKLPIEEIVKIYEKKECSLKDSDNFKDLLKRLLDM